MIPAIRTVPLFAGACLLGSLCACGGAGQGASAEDAASAKRDTELTHEECDIASDDAVKDDGDNDGHPELIRVLEGGREICRAVDINRDSLIDAYVYFDEQGNERRREYGFDRDDRPDEIVIYEGGQLSAKLRETNNDRKIDTWDYYQGGRLVREERDSSGDGYVDQWWTFPNPDDPKCAVVVSDVNGDGKPDEESRLDLCADNDSVPPAAPPPSPSPAGSASKPGPDAAPKSEGASGGSP
jgi:hypothetical protein